MKRNIRNAAILLTGLVFFGSSAMVLHQSYQYRMGEETYSEAEALVDLPNFSDAEVDLSDLPVPAASEPEDEVPPDPYAQALAAIDFAALREVNDEVLGWIEIPDTPVSYPLLQAQDNQKYLNTTWQGSRNSVGAIFMECQNSSDFSDFNTIIYGHRTANRSMFGSLKDYAQQSYWEAHPYIYIADDTGCRVYAVFSAYEAGVTDRTYQLGMHLEKSRQDFLDFCVEQSVIETGIVPTVEDSILTLSTCVSATSNNRWVVQAVELGIVEKEEITTETLSTQWKVL